MWYDDDDDDDGALLGHKCFTELDLLKKKATDKIRKNKLLTVPYKVSINAC